MPDIKEHGDTVHTEYCPYCMTPVEADAPCPSCGLTAGSYVAQPKHLPAGTVLRGRYLVGRVLGEGGFGITYIGRDMVLGLKVAIKEYFPTDKATRNSMVSVSVDNFLGAQNDFFERGKQRFLQEARTMARLDRLPNIVGVRDFFEENSTAYIVMEYIDGTTLSEITKQRGGVMPAWELLHLIEPLFDSLSAMHELNLIHRDISPDNLMLEHGIIKLLDFGCAREAADGDATMTIMLRHGYAPLEQYQSSSGAQGAWTDVYALAATIYFCITGKKPPQAMDRIFEDSLIPPRKLGAELSVGQEQALMHALRVRPRERYQTVKEFHTALYEGVVTVYLTGGDEDTELSVSKGDVLKAQELPVPVRKGFIFAGWFTDKQLEKPMRSLTVTEETTLYAAWEKPAAPKVPIWKRRPYQLAAAAVVAVAIIGGAVAAVIGGGDKPEEPPPVDPGENTDENTGDKTEPGDTTPPPSEPENAGTVLSWYKEQFYELLGDKNDYELIKYVGDELIIDSPLEITKPVNISEIVYFDVRDQLTLKSTLTVDCETACNNGTITVAGEGAELIMNQSCYGTSFFRTRDGGRITCNSGECQLDTVWLSDYADLTVARDSVAMDGGTAYIVFDEDHSFDSAVHVTDAQLLRSAASNGSVPAIVIDGDIFLTGGQLDVNKPVMISEGASFSSDGSQLIIHSALVNNGSITGNTGGGEALDIVDGAVFVNNGTLDIDSDVYMSGGYFVNYGDVTPMAMDLYGTYAVNLGKMSVGRDVDTGLSLEGATFITRGIFKQNGSRLWFGCGSSVENRGYMSLDADVENRGRIINRGEISLTGTLNNYSSFIGLTGPSETVYGDGIVRGGVAVISEDLGTAEDALNRDDQCRVIVDRVTNKEIYVPATDAQHLIDVSAGHSDVQGMRVDHDIAVDGDLTMEKDLLINSGCTLEVTGTLTLSGSCLNSEGTLRAGSIIVEDGGYMSTGGNNQSPYGIEVNGGDIVITGGSGGVAYSGIQMNGGKLTVTDGSTFFNSNQIDGCSGLTVGRDSTVLDFTNIRYADGATVTVNDGGALTAMSFDGSIAVTVNAGGKLAVATRLRINGSGSFTNHGDVNITAGSVSFEAPVDNRGSMSIDAWTYNDFFIRSEFTNRGNMQLSGNIVIDWNGTLTNRGNIHYNWGMLTNNGRVVNRGTFDTEENFDLANFGAWDGSAAR